ncbi:MAG: ATP-dependent DNA ligase, partial [Saprospiraceae bacterium]|nr:ATP-dependent DNA ligase [Saprospiraceae bacterium]
EEESRIAHRLMGNWHPDDTSWQELFHDNIQNADISKPYPFFLAYSLEDELDSLGSPTDWSAEFKWDGIRGQVIKRQGDIFVWSRGEELVTENILSSMFCKR